MAKIDSNLLIDQEWTGTFFPPGFPDKSFAGKLSYSPTDGLHLEFAFPMDLDYQDLFCDFLLGHTSKGEPLTLVGRFSCESHGFTMKNGLAYWQSSGHPFRYVIFGHHFDEKVTFDSFEFDISGTQEFFVSKGSKNRIPFKKCDIVNAESSVGNFKVSHLGSFEFAGDDIRAHFHSDDNDALNKLQEIYKEFRANNPGFNPYIKKSLDYILRFIPPEELSIADAYSEIKSVADLFSMLTFEPARVAKFLAIARDEKEKPVSMVIFPFSVCNKDVLKHAQLERNHYNLPLNNNDVNLEEIIPNWIDQKDQYSTTASFLQNKVGVFSDNSIYGNIVLSITQLEGISVKEEAEYKKRFEYGVLKYSSDNLLQLLITLLQCTKLNIGENISDLRNDIAHVGRPKKILHKIEMRNLLRILISLQAVVIGYALENLGLESKAREKYQDSVIF